MLRLSDIDTPQSQNRIPDVRLSVYFETWLAHTRHNLSDSVAQTLTVSDLLSLGTEDDVAAFDGLALEYTSPRGSASLREAVASTYETVTPDDIVCFAGADEALYLVLQELLSPGDHAIVTVPNYETMELVPLSTGAEVSGVMLDHRNGWRFDLGDLVSHIRPNTSVIAVNFPNTPTGVSPTVEDFVALAGICAERDIVLVSDEVHRGLEVDQTKTLPQAVDLSTTAISINVMSKAYGLPGLRIGWIACRNRLLLHRLGRRRNHVTVCNATPSEHLAAMALRARSEILARNRRLVADNLDLLDEFFARHHDVFAWRRPDGGCIGFPRFLGAEGAEAFCLQAVKQEGVLLIPGALYRSALVEVPTDFLRIGFGQTGLADALAALDRVIETRLH